MAGLNAIRPTLSVIVPCLNEAQRLPLLLADLQRWDGPLECIVVDGGSHDRSQDRPGAVQEHSWDARGAPSRSKHGRHGRRGGHAERRKKGRKEQTYEC